jgi:NagD protein
MVDIASERSGLPAESFAIIGDRLATDMQMGFNHHVTTILLLTGDTTREHLAAAPRQPDYVYTDLTAVQHDLV